MRCSPRAPSPLSVLLAVLAVLLTPGWAVAAWPGANGDVLVAGGNASASSVYGLDPSSGQIVQTVDPPVDAWGYRNGTLDVSPDGEHIIQLHGTRAQAGSIRPYAATAGYPGGGWSGYRGGFYDAQYVGGDRTTVVLRDGTLLFPSSVENSSDRQLKVTALDGSGGRVAGTLTYGSHGSVRGLAASPTSDRVYFVGASLTEPPVLTAYGFDTVTGATASLGVLPRTEGGATLFTADVRDVSPDGRYLLLTTFESGPQTRLVAYEIATGARTPLVTLSGGGGADAKFSPDGKQLAYLRSGVVSIADLTYSGDDIGPATAARPLAGVASIDTPTMIAWQPVRAVSFDVTPAPGVPESFGFRNRSKNPAGKDMLVVSWDFGDGVVRTGFADNVSHSYEEPGDYTVTLTVRDPDTGEVRTGTETVTVKAPTPSVLIRWDEEIETEGRLPVDEPFAATVTVRAGSDGVGELSDLSFDEDALLRWTPGDKLDVVAAGDDIDPDPFSLQPGQSRTFDVEVTALEPGRVTLQSGITGKDGAGRNIQAETAQPVRLGFEFEVTASQKLLTEPLDQGGVEVAMPPTGIELEFDGETGDPIPQDMTLTLDVKNISGATAKDLTMDAAALNRGNNTVHPLKVLRYQVGTSPPVAVSPAADALADFEIPGTLASGETTRVKFWLRATDEGSVTVQNIIRATTTATPAEALSGFSKQLVRIGQDVLLYVEGQDLVAAQRAGDVWTMSGTVKNVSTDTAVELAVFTERSGNVVGAPVADTLAPTNNPIGVRKRLEPGERLLLGGSYTSELEGAPTGKLELVVLAEVPDDSEGARPGAMRDVAAEEIVAGKQRSAGQGEYPATERRLSVDISDPLPDATTWTGYDVGWFFADGLGRGFGTWVDSLPERLRRDTPQFAGINAYFWYMLRTTFKYSEPAELEGLKAEIVGYYQSFADLLDTDAEDAVDQAIQSKITEVSQRWESGDLPYFASATGRLLGENGVDMAIEGALGRAIATRGMVRNGKVVTGRVAETQRATRAGRIAALGRRGYDPGDEIWLDEAMRFFGQDIELDTAMLRYAKAKGLIIAMRDRSPGSIQRLAEGLLGKIEKVKSKNVSQLDVDFLGFHPTHLDTAMYKQMPPWSQVQAKLPAGASDELVKKVKARWYQRSEEFYKEHKLMRKYAADGKIPVPGKKYGLNPSDNGIKVDKDEIWDARDFKLQRAGADDLAATSDGLPAFQPRVRGTTVAGDGFHAMTGDMDLIAILNRKGQILSKRERIEIYKDLAKLGYQHPESLTWDNVAGRTKYLWDYDMDNAGGESLLAYMADGTRRAVKLDANKSVYDNPVLNFMFLHGFAPDPEAPAPNLPDTPELPDVVEPPADFELDAKIDTDYLGPSGDEGARFNAEPGMPLIRRNLNGTYDQWTPDTGWQPYTPPAGGPIAQVPQTAARVPTEAGETRIVIFEQDAMDLRSTAWFTPGMQLVINPGGANQEIITVKELGSIVTTEPLRFAHRRGELVGMVPLAASVPGPQPDPAPAPQPVDPPALTPTLPRLPAAAAPVAGKTVPAISGQLRAGATLRCSTGAWTGASTYAFAWEYEVKKTVKVKGKRGQTRTVTSWRAIKRATKTSYKLKTADAGRRLRCTVTARSAGGQAVRSSKPKLVAKTRARR